MPTKSSGEADKRIPVKGATLERLRAFSHGLDASYDKAVNVLLDSVGGKGEDEYAAGKRLRIGAHSTEEQ